MAIMNLCIASSGAEHVRRGVETYSRSLYLALREHPDASVCFAAGGHAGTRNSDTHYVFCLRRESRLNHLLCIVLGKLGGWRLFLHRDFGLEHFTFAFFLCFLLRRQRVGIVYTQEVFTALHLERFRKWGLHSSRIVYSTGTLAELSRYRHMPFVLHLMPFALKKDLEQLPPETTRFWAAIPNFVETAHFFRRQRLPSRQSFDLPETEWIALSVGAFNAKEKGYTYLIDEVAALPEAERPFLLLVGAFAPEYPLLLQQAQRLLGDRFRFLTDIPYARMPEIYSAADVYIQASPVETFAGALTEAMACELPCLVNDYPSMSEKVDDPSLLFRHGEKDSLKERLRSLRDPQTQKLKGKSMGRKAQTLYGRQQVVDALIAYFKTIG